MGPTSASQMVKLYEKMLNKHVSYLICDAELELAAMELRFNHFPCEMEIFHTHKLTTNSC